MNNNLKRILNKISGIDQSTSQPSNSFQLPNYCDCVYLGISKTRKHLLSQDLETLIDERVVKQITRECLKTSNYSGPRIVDSLAFTKRQCPNLDYMLRLAECRFRCIHGGPRTNPNPEEPAACVGECLTHPLGYYLH